MNDTGRLPCIHTHRAAMHSIRHAESEYFDSFVLRAQSLCIYVKFRALIVSCYLHVSLPIDLRSLVQQVAECDDIPLFKIPRRNDLKDPI